MRNGFERQVSAALDEPVESFWGETPYGDEVELNLECFTSLWRIRRPWQSDPFSHLEVRLTVGVLALRSAVNFAEPMVQRYPVVSRRPQVTLS